MACDINESARQTYEHNYSVQPLGDIVDIDPTQIQSFDILCSGFPCQSFSRCGRQKGFDDERGTMFFQVMKFVRFHHPPIIILENVPALLTHDNNNTFSCIKHHLENEGYNVRHKIIKCSDYGIPQMRKRLFIVAILVSSTIDIDKILECSRYEKQVSLSSFLGKPFQREYAYTIRCGGRQSPINDRHNWDGYIINGEEYRLTIEDALLLQGFDATFHLCGTVSAKWKQLGNTIPTIFTEMIGQNIQMQYKDG
jgi:DNA (cytosine-5)-methyltransferase 1